MSAWHHPAETVAAFVISIIAVVVAGLSAWYTRRQADAAEGVRKIEADRRHEELRPVLSGVNVDASETRDGLRPGIKLTNSGPLDLDRIEVSAISAHRAHEAAIAGIYDHGTGATAPIHETGMMRRGESWTVEIIPATYKTDDGDELDRGGTAQFRCVCYASGHDPG